MNNQPYVSLELFIEQDEKWSTGRKYFEMDQYHASKTEEGEFMGQTA